MIGIKELKKIANHYATIFGRKTPHFKTLINIKQMKEIANHHITIFRKKTTHSKASSMYY
jgi:hypothetical protein